MICGCRVSNGRDGDAPTEDLLFLLLPPVGPFLGCGRAGAGAQEGDRSPEGRGMMGHGGMMGCGMMGRGGMMGSGGMMGHGAAMRFIFALMDSDGDGTGLVAKRISSRS